VLTLSRLPAALREPAAQAWSHLAERLEADARLRIERACADEALAFDLARVLATSEFVVTVAAAQGDWFSKFIETRSGAVSPPADFVGDALAGVDDVDDLKRALRALRARAMVHVVWREVLGLADFDETVASMTRLAEQCIGAALDRLHAAAVAREGEPTGEESGAAQRLVVLSLGKLGAMELNLSSDVDLVFAYPEAGTTHSAGGGDGRTNQQFFVRLAQRLVQVLDDLTADGFVFRVDMRLRPYGESGALVLPFEAMEIYFQDQGRDWERYAWIRARPCAGDRDAGARLVRQLRPFVFRRYLDFGAVQALREMKARIDGERARESVRDDVKLGPGGIREVEFVAQMLQLIWAGREPTLLGTRMCATLRALAGLGHLETAQARELEEAYVFLRNVEHRIQALRDEQTQLLPASEVDRARVATSLGFADWEAFRAVLDLHRTRVARAFDSVIGGSAATGDSDSERFTGVWTMPDAHAVAAALAADGFGEVATVLHEVERLRGTRDRPWVGGEGRQRFDTLMPKLLNALAAQPEPGETLVRLTPLLEAVMRRSSYFALLLENPAALRRLVELCSESRFLAGELARHPMLLDELLDEALLYTVADRGVLEADLARRLAGVEEFERQIEVLRQFKESHQFRVAVCELRGILPLMKISDYLTFLAEVILAAALDIAWRSTAADDANVPAQGPFVVVGYGKLGGLELGPGSDLDLVFLHDLPEGNERFLQRMVRRLLHILTTRTQAGALYEVDTRLRPSGRRGTMVSSLAGFERYQREDAWVWEHQALVRARVVAGDPRLGADFERVRREVICLPREAAELRAEIVDMRRRIEKTAAGEVDLKREPGGIVDIEFMVQYLALAHAATHPALADWTDNVRILETLAREGLLAEDVAAGLKDAYLALRAESHRTALDRPDDARAREVLERYRSFVRAQWQQILQDDRARLT
jgi:glutamate-ammonia-ligase adenylyltransferase